MCLVRRCLVMFDIEYFEEEIKQICSGLHLKKLDLFGSATTDDFGPNSDVDVIVEFEKNENSNRFDDYFVLKEKLQNVFHRQIDIIIDGSVKNPYLQASIDQTRKNIYAA